MFEAGLGGGERASYMHFRSLGDYIGILGAQQPQVPTWLCGTHRWQWYYIKRKT